MRVRVVDLDPLHSVELSGERPDLRGLTDEELLATCTQPRNGDPIKINTRSGKVVDGNGRVHELRRRARITGTTITPDTEVECEPYSSDFSMFPDIE